MNYKEFNIALKPEIVFKMELLAVEENALIKNQTHKNIFRYYHKDLTLKKTSIL